MTTKHIGGEGVITGCDKAKEWLLEWWWENYNKACSHPVTFLDYGMSKMSRMWCEERGTVISSTLKTKTLSLLQTPYDKTIWINIDCEVKKDLSLLFTFCESPDGFAISSIETHRGEVFSYKRGSPFIEEWAKNSSTLDQILEKNNFDITIFSKQYHPSPWKKQSVTP